MIRVFLVFTLATVILAHSKNQKAGQKKLIHRENLEAGGHYRIVVPDVPIYIQKRHQMMDQSSKNNGKNGRNKRKKMNTTKYTIRKTPGRRNLVLFDHQKVQKLKESSREAKSRKRYQQTNQNSLSQKELYGYLEKLGYTVDENPFPTYSSEFPHSKENFNAGSEINPRTKTNTNVAHSEFPEVYSQDLNSGQSYDVFEENSSVETTVSGEIDPTNPILKADTSSKFSPNLLQENDSIKSETSDQNYEAKESGIISEDIPVTSKSTESQVSSKVDPLPKILSQTLTPEIDPVEIADFHVSKDPQILNQKIIPEVESSKNQETDDIPVAKSLDLQQLLDNPNFVLNTQELKKFTEDSSKSFLETTFVTYESLENDGMSSQIQNGTKNSSSDNFEKPLASLQLNSTSQPISLPEQSSIASDTVSGKNVGENESSRNSRMSSRNSQNQEETNIHPQESNLLDKNKFDKKTAPINKSFGIMEILIKSNSEPPLDKIEGPQKRLELITEKKKCTKSNLSNTFKENKQVVNSLEQNPVMDLSTLNRNLDSIIKNLGFQEHNAGSKDRNSSNLGHSFGSMEHNLSYQEIQISSNGLQLSPMEYRNGKFAISSDNLREINQLQTLGTKKKFTKKLNGPVPTIQTPILQKLVQLEPESKGPNVYEHVFLHLLGPSAQDVTFEKNIPVELVIHK